MIQALEESAVQQEWYQRWLDFAQRMALHAWPNMTEKRKKRLRGEVTGFIENYAHEAEALDWDSAPHYICDRFSEAFRTYDEERWAFDWPANSFINQAACCIRAGLDMAGNPSAGVVGFTLGDLRRMYDGQIPEWINELYRDSAELNTLADDEGIWL